MSNMPRFKIPRDIVARTRKIDEDDETEAKCAVVSYGASAIFSGLAGEGEALQMNAMAVQRATSRINSSACKPEELGPILKVALLANDAYMPEADLKKKYKGVETSGRGRTFWFLQETDDYMGRGRALFLVFRGTSNAAEIGLDLLAVPPSKAAALCGERPNPECSNMHLGFLMGILSQRDAINSALSRRPTLPLVIIGHSLGGALAMAAATTEGVIPTKFKQKNVFMFGAPMIYHERTKSLKAHGIETAFLIVNEADIVPRLLGGTSIYLSHFKSMITPPEVSEGGKQAARKFAEIIDMLPQYVHPAGLVMMVLKSNKAFGASKDHHAAWLSLDALVDQSSNVGSCLFDHSMETGYIERIKNCFVAACARAGNIDELRQFPHDS